MCRWWSKGDLSLLWGHYHFELIFEHFFTSTKNLDMGQTHSPFGYARISKALVQLPPVLEAPPWSLQADFFKVAQSLPKRVFCAKFKYKVGLMAFPSEKMQLTWQVLFPIFEIISLRKISWGEKTWVFWSWSLRGCPEPASQARGLAWILEPAASLEGGAS